MVLSIVMSNYFIKNQSLVYVQLNDQIIQFLTIQFTIIYLFSQFKCQTVVFDL